MQGILDLWIKSSNLQLDISGENCEEDINDCIGVECFHGGTCVDGINHYKCDCVQGYEGANCYYPTNECEGVHCQNGGKCFDGHNEYFCQCKYGFTGITFVLIVKLIPFCI